MLPEWLKSWKGAVLIWAMCLATTASMWLMFGKEDTLSILGAVWHYFAG